MLNQNYLPNRKKWNRPQAIILSNNSYGILNGVPQIEGIEGEDFIVLSDHNRSEISIAPNRIENKKRMVNAHMRSYYIADKITVSTAWSNLPSRSYNYAAEFSEDGKIVGPGRIQYTVDGGAGGEDLVRWYNNNPGSFFMFLSYDNSEDREYTIDRFISYSDVIEVFFSSFDYKIVKRGQGTHDLWDISVAFEEV